MLTDRRTHRLEPRLCLVEEVLLRADDRAGALDAEEGNRLVGSEVIVLQNVASVESAIKKHPMREA